MVPVAVEEFVGAEVFFGFIPYVNGQTACYALNTVALSVYLVKHKPTHNQGQIRD